MPLRHTAILRISRADEGTAQGGLGPGPKIRQGHGSVTTESDDRTRPASSKSRPMQTTRNCPMTCFPLCHGQVPTDELDTDRDISVGQYDEELSADHSPPLNGFALGSQAGMPYAGIELGRRNDCDTTGTHHKTLSRSAFLLSETRREITGLPLGMFHSHVLDTAQDVVLPLSRSFPAPYDLLQ